MHIAEFINMIQKKKIALELIDIMHAFHVKLRYSLIILSMKTTTVVVPFEIKKNYIKM